MNCEIIQEKYYSKQAERHGKKFNRMNDVITTIFDLLAGKLNGISVYILLKSRTRIDRRLEAEQLVAQPPEQLSK